MELATDVIRMRKDGINKGDTTKSTETENGKQHTQGKTPAMEIPKVPNPNSDFNQGTSIVVGGK